MQKVKIKLYGVEEVKNLVNTISEYDYEFDLTSGRYVIDAKSMIGIFSLNLENPLTLVIHCDDEEKTAEILGRLADFIDKSNEQEN